MAVSGNRLEAAVVAHRAGDVSGARTLYEAILHDEPGIADALHLLGLLA